MKKIEIVCIGNNGRSPIAEAVFKDEAGKKGLENRLEITSSGIYVNKRHPFDMQAATIKKALDNPDLNIYGAEEAVIRQLLEDPKTKARYENDPEFRERFHYYFDQTYRLLQAADIAFRNNILARHNLEYTSQRNQFPSNENLDYVLTATKALIEPAKELMQDPSTIITSLPEFTGTDDIKGGFGKFDIIFYEKMYQRMREIAPVVLENISL